MTKDLDNIADEETEELIVPKESTREKWVKIAEDYVIQLGKYVIYGIKPKKEEIETDCRKLARLRLSLLEDF